MVHFRVQRDLMLLSGPNAQHPVNITQQSRHATSDCDVPGSLDDQVQLPPSTLPAALADPRTHALRLPGPETHSWDWLGRTRQQLTHDPLSEKV